MADAARDDATLRLGDLDPQTDERDVAAAFAAHPPVSCRVARDWQTGECLGHAFLNYGTPAEALAALRDCAFRVYVRGRPANLSLVRSRHLSGDESPSTLYVGCLPPPPFGVRDLHALFESFGTIVRCVLKGSGGESPHGFIEFLRASEARHALALNGLRVGPRSIRVAVATSKSERSGRSESERNKAVPISVPSRAEVVFRSDESVVPVEQSITPMVPPSTHPASPDARIPAKPLAEDARSPSRPRKRKADSGDSSHPPPKRNAPPLQPFVVAATSPADEESEVPLRTPADVQMEMFRPSRMPGRAEDANLRDNRPVAASAFAPEGDSDETPASQHCEQVELNSVAMRPGVQVSPEPALAGTDAVAPSLLDLRGIADRLAGTSSRVAEEFAAILREMNDALGASSSEIADANSTSLPPGVAGVARDIDGGGADTAPSATEAVPLHAGECRPSVAPVATVSTAGTRAVVAYADGSCWWLNGMQGSLEATKCVQLGSAISAVALCETIAFDAKCPKGDFSAVVCGSGDGVLRAVNCDSGSELWSFELGDAVSAVCVDAHCGRCIVGLHAGNAIELDISHKALVRRFVGHEGTVGAVSLLAEATGRSCLLTASHDGTVRLFDRADGTCVRVYLDHAAPVLCVVATAEKLYTGSSDCVAREFVLATAECTRIFAGHGGPVLGLALVGDSLTTASADSYLRVFSVQGATTRAVVHAVATAITAAAFVEGGRCAVLTGHADGRVAITDVSAGAAVPCAWNHCRAGCATPGRLAAHLASAHVRPAASPLVCRWAHCGVDFANWAQLRAHLRAAHVLEIPDHPDLMGNSSSAENGTTATKDNGSAEPMGQRPLGESASVPQAPSARPQGPDISRGVDGTGPQNGSTGRRDNRDGDKRPPLKRATARRSEMPQPRPRKATRETAAGHQCDVCLRWFASRTNLRNHKTNVHDFLADLCSSIGLDGALPAGGAPPKPGEESRSEGSDDAHYAYDASDPYSVLRLPRTASQAEIRRQYRALALRWHPDRNPEDAEEANRRFKDIAAAYGALATQ